MKVAFVCHYRDRERLDANFLASVEPQLRDGDEVHTLAHFSSMTRAYADAEQKTKADVMVFAHEDAFLPIPWRAHLVAGVEHLNRVDPTWLVAGVFGTMMRAGYQFYHGHVRDTFAARHHGSMYEPSRVDTLDGLVLIKRPGIRVWDQALPGWDCYDVDACLQAHELRLGVWVVPIFTEHRCRHRDLETDEGYKASRAYLMKKWAHVRPIVTTVGIWS